MQWRNTKAGPNDLTLEIKGLQPVYFFHLNSPRPNRPIPRRSMVECSGTRLVVLENGASIIPGLALVVTSKAKCMGEMDLHQWHQMQIYGRKSLTLSPGIFLDYLGC